MKEIKDYLHLYLGCECYLPKWGKREILTMVSNDSQLGWFRISNPDNYGWAEFQLILRPLSDMTEEEMLEVDVEIPNLLSEYEKLSPVAFRFLLSKGFDLFGLIEDGLAIDKTKPIEP